MFLKTYKSITQPVTASPSFRHFSGFASFSLHVMYALLIFEQRVAMCFDIAIRTAEVGAGDAAVSLIFASLCAVWWAA